MQVRISIPVYNVAPEGHTVHSYTEGMIVTGRAAELALADKAGVLVSELLETKIVAPAETKSRKRRGA